MKLIKLLAYGALAVGAIFVAFLALAYYRTMNAPTSQIDAVANRESVRAVSMGMNALYIFIAIVGVYLLVRFIKWAAK